MKKTLTFMMFMVATLLLVACKPNVRHESPTIGGDLSPRTIEVGDESFNPLAGITAKDPKVDITNRLEHDFNMANVNIAGSYTYNVTVKNEHELEARVQIDLTVGKASNLSIEGPGAITHYIGNREFNPLEEFRVFEGINEVHGVAEVIDDEYSLNHAGTYTYSVRAVTPNSEPVVKNVTLTVRAKADYIPNQLATTPIKVVMWHSNGTAIEGKLTQYATQFSEEMAAQGYNIEVELVKNGSNYDELRKNVMNALKGGTLPNIVQNYPDHVVEYAAAGAITSINPYMNHPVHGYDQNDAGDKFTDILASYRGEQRATNAQGDYISLPFNKSTEVVAYNKTMFDAVLNGRPFPTTWQGLFNYSDDLIGQADRMIDTIAQKWAAASSPLSEDQINTAKNRFVPYSYDSTGNAFITLVRQFGGQYTSRDANGKGQLDFDNEATREMLRYFGEKRGVEFTVPNFWEAQYTNAVSLHGTAAFSVGSTGGIRYNTPVEKGFELFEIGVAPVPYDQSNRASRSVIQQGTNMSLTSAGSDQEKLAAWYFLKYLTSKDIQSDFGIATGYSPVRDSSYTTPEYVKYLEGADIVMKKSFTEQGVTAGEYKTMYEEKITAMGSKAASEQRNYQFYDQPFIGSSATRANVGVAFERVILAPLNANLEQIINDAIAYAIDESNKTLG